MSHQPYLSVIVPIYNASEYLRPCLDSLMQQTFSDFEAILVNDGSTDNSLAVMKEYASADHRCRIIDVPNGGYGKAINRGMDAAQGLYMAILEPDDMLPSRAYEALWGEAEKNGRPDIVRGTYLNMKGASGERQYEWVNVNQYLNKVFDPREDYTFFPSSTWSALYRLDFVRANGLRHHESAGASFQDVGWFIQTLCMAESLVSTDEIVYLYRIDNPLSSVKQYDRKYKALLNEYRFVRERLLQKSGVWERVQKGVYMRFVCNIISVYELISRNYISDFVTCLKECVQEVFSDVSELIPGRKKKKWNWILTRKEKYPIRPITSIQPVRYKRFCGVFRYKIERTCEMVELEPGITYPIHYREVRSICGIPFSIRKR